MIKIVSISKDEKAYFTSLDPLFLMDRMDLGGCLALAAIEEDKPGDIAKPAGIMIFSEGRDSYCINWLYVSQEYRLAGVGNLLINKLFELSKARGFLRLEAYFNLVPDREKVWQEQDKYFAERLFTKRKDMPGEWHSCIGDLDDSFQPIKISDKGVVVLSSLAEKERFRALTQLNKMEHQLALFGIKGFETNFDTDISMVLIEDGLIRGGFLLQTLSVTGAEIENRIIIPVFLAGAGKRPTVAMIKKSVQAAAKKYPKDTKIQVICHTKVMSEFLDKLMPDCHIEAFKLWASVDEYYSKAKKVDDYYFL